MQLQPIQILSYPPSKSTPKSQILPTNSNMKPIPNFMLKYKSYLIILGCCLAAQLVIYIRFQYYEDLAHMRHIGKDTRSIHQSLEQLAQKTNHQNEYAAQSSKNQNGRQVSLSSLPDFNLTNYLPPGLTFSNCEIFDKDAISAIQRAKTQSCRTKIINITCNANQGLLYPTKLPRFCKNQDSSHLKYLGCFQDDKSNRLLNSYSIVMKNINSPNNCVDVCLQLGFPYAGLQYSVECFCGNNTPSSYAKINFNECNMKCPGMDPESQKVSGSYCGGYFTMDVYETGVFREREGKTDSLIHIRNLDSNSLDRTNQTARIVYFLTLNGRALRQVIRLIKLLYNANQYFYIHVDARQDYMFRQLMVLNYTLPNNIRFMKDRRATIWGGSSLLQVLLYGMKDVIKNSAEWGWKWDYVINLSESDFPIKPVNDLEKFLGLNVGKNFLKSHGRDVQRFIQKQGLDKTFIECEYRMWRTGNRTLPSGILIDGGSDWIGLHYDFVKFVVGTEDELVKGLLKIFEHTLLPAESFFHTVLRNSELCHTFVDNNLHVTNWKRKFGCKCQYKSIVDWCGCSPNDFRLSDWSRIQLTKSKHLYFARKFEPIVNQGIINKLEIDINPNFNDQMESIDRYWESIYHVHDLSPPADDAIITLGYSLSRLTAKNVSSVIGQELISATSIEILVHSHKDEIQGILVRSETQSRSRKPANGKLIKVNTESWFKLANFISYEPFSIELLKYYNKIQVVRIGTNYEQKEQIFRNFCRAIGPMSEPILSYRTNSHDQPLNVTFVWINPLNSVQNVQYFVSGVGETANFVKPSLKQPLIPGNWTVKILTDQGGLIATTNFYVNLLEFYKGRMITPSVDKLFNSYAQKQMPHENRLNEIRDLLDQSNSKLYQLENICIENTNSNLSLGYKNCKEVVWSSLYSDPKGMIFGISPETKQLV